MEKKRQYCRKFSIRCGWSSGKNIAGKGKKSMNPSQRSNSFKKWTAGSVFLLFLFIAAALGIGSCWIPCDPSGIYYSTAFECLHTNNRGFCIITKERLIYVVNYDEDIDPNSIKILFRGPLVLMEDGKYGLKDSSGRVFLTMKSYWWGLKIYADRGDMLYGWRQFGIKPPQ